jgi:hypothetical protein
MFFGNLLSFILIPKNDKTTGSAIGISGWIAVETDFRLACTATPACN